MLECLILGDSIAVGVGMQRPECVSYAKSGINTVQWNNKYLAKDLSAKTVIISLGSNDHKGIKTRHELETLRELVQADRVYWILPHGNQKGNEVPVERIQQYVYEVALLYKDVVLPIAYPSKDNIHPSTRGYKDLADKAR